MLTFENVSRVFPGPQGEVTALRQVSMAAAPGELVAVRGPSGCGKSTLLLVAGGLLRPTAGEVCWHAEPIYRLSPGKRAAWRARQVGFVFQQFHLVPYLTVRENILLPSVAWPMPGAAARTDDRPSLLACRTVIGKGLPRVQGQRGGHSARLHPQDADEARALLGWPHPAFEVPTDVLAAWRASPTEPGQPAAPLASNALEVYVHRLRKKLDASPLNIRNIRGLGYMLNRP
mgnify:CR=1 FL=1